MQPSPKIAPKTPIASQMRDGIGHSFRGLERASARKCLLVCGSCFAIPLQAIYRAEREVEEIAAARAAAAEANELTEPYYDAGGMPRRQAEDPAVRVDVFRTDYLAAFWPRGDAQTLTREEAQHAKDACLKVRSRRRVCLHKLMVPGCCC